MNVHGIRFGSRFNYLGFNLSGIEKVDPFTYIKITYFKIIISVQKLDWFVCLAWI